MVSRLIPSMLTRLPLRVKSPPQETHMVAPQRTYSNVADIQQMLDCIRNYQPFLVCHRTGEGNKRHLDPETRSNCGFSLSFLTSRYYRSFCPSFSVHPSQTTIPCMEQCSFFHFSNFRCLYSYLLIPLSILGQVHDKCSKYKQWLAQNSSKLSQRTEEIYKGKGATAIKTKKVRRRENNEVVGNIRQTALDATPFEQRNTPKRQLEREKGTVSLFASP